MLENIPTTYRRVVLKLVDQLVLIGLITIALYEIGFGASMLILCSYLMPQFVSLLSFNLETPYQIRVSQGGSMRPTIPYGQSIHLGFSNPENVEVGDVVSFEHSKRKNAVMHRVVNELPNGELVTKGDGNERADYPPISSEDITTRVAQIGSQPLYIPLTPMSVVGTMWKILRFIFL